MVGIVYLKTNKFEVKLEGIAFKVREFESLCSMDFLFPEGKIRRQRPIVGVDVMTHPRDPNILLLLLCVGIGCVILRFDANDVLPESIKKFLMDDRIRFVGFKIPEKNHLFPFAELGLRKSNVDVGHLAAKVLNDPKLKNYELAELAKKVIGINRMVGLAEASSFGRHEQIKIAVCEVFISSVIAMMLMNPKKKKSEDSPKKDSPKKNSPKKDSPKKSSPKKALAEKLDLSKLFKGKGELNCLQNNDGFQVQALGKGFTVEDDSGYQGELSSPNKPLKGILKKLPSFSRSVSCKEDSPQYSSSPSKSREQANAKGAHLRRANSKGHNVSFNTD